MFWRVTTGSPRVDYNSSVGVKFVPESLKYLVWICLEICKINLEMQENKKMINAAVKIEKWQTLQKCYFWLK